MMQQFQFQEKHFKFDQWKLSLKALKIVVLIKYLREWILKPSRHFLCFYDLLKFKHLLNVDRVGKNEIKFLRNKPSSSDVINP